MEDWAKKTDQSNVQVDNTVFNKNISNLPKDKVIDVDPATYKQAAKDFLELASQDFIYKYPELSKADAMYKTVLEQVNLRNGNYGQIDGRDATEYVRKSVKENLAEDIAEAKYLVVDREKSKVLAEIFINAKTPEQRSSAIQAHPELEQVFMFDDAMQKISGAKAEISKSTAESIERGDIPQLTTDLKRAVETHENNRSAEMTF